MKQSWLMYAETVAAGLPGLLHLCRGVPLRFTDTVSAKDGACKHTPCELVDWQLHEEDAERLKTCCTAGMTLRHVLRGLPVSIADARSGKSVSYVVRPVTRAWQRGAEALNDAACE